MTFDIHRSVSDQDGMLREKAAFQYKDQLLELFVKSPEWQTVQDEDIDTGWANMMIEYGMEYLGVTPAQMSPANLREILFDIFPRKVSAEADEAPDIIRELQLFFQFLEREFHLANATACLKILDDRATRQLAKEMGNPANFGMAKSFVMMGMARGFDMTSEEDINKWMAIYNAELATAMGPPLPLPGGLMSPAPRAVPRIPWPGQSASTGKAQDKIRRKLARDSRRKNRNKK